MPGDRSTALLRTSHRFRGPYGSSHAYLNIIEREIPGASELTHDELRGITTKSNEVVDEMSRPYTWRHSYVAGDKMYCAHGTENAEDVLDHARGGGFPANLVAEVTAVFDSTGRASARPRATAP